MVDFENLVEFLDGFQKNVVYDLSTDKELLVESKNRVMTFLLLFFFNLMFLAG